MIVELFTSEGCSDCPAADRLLAKLEAEQPVPGAEIIVLGEHVDYWNHDGWVDRFSSHEFTQRQESYSREFGLDSIYTPQMVVDGRTEFVGSSERNAVKALEKAIAEPHATVAGLSSFHAETGKNGTFTFTGITVSAVPKVERNESVDIVLALTEADLHSEVKDGENKGRSLSHTGIIRSMKIIGTWDGKSEMTTKPTSFFVDSNRWKTEKMRAIVFLQGHTTRHIYGAKSVALSQ